MKEHIEYTHDYFTDYLGKIHYFVIVAISQELPKYYRQLEDVDSPGADDDSPIAFEIWRNIDEGMDEECMGKVTKVIRLGISICNPSDSFDEQIGVRKAVARARSNEPVIYATHPGVINTRMVKALLEQEAEYFRNNPENFINGYAESRDRYLKNKEMEKVESEFTELEQKVVTEIQNNPKFLDKILSFIKWLDNQRKGKCQK